MLARKICSRINSPVDSNSWSAVARAVIQRPKLILADEPTAISIPPQGEEIMELFKKLNEEGTTIIQVTHSEKNATYGNRIVQLGDGWVVGENATEATRSAQ